MTVQYLLHRPIYGGVFGDGRFALASQTCITRGLYAIRYMVVEPAAGMVLSVADDKVAALVDARRLLTAANDLHGPRPDPLRNQLTLWPSQDLAPVASPLPQASRRRREIFEKCGGQCHYCSEPLKLDSPWHVEHMQPRALGGGDDPLNLVAACVRCNLEKADRTALEFIAGGPRS